MTILTNREYPLIPDVRYRFRLMKKIQPQAGYMGVENGSNNLVNGEAFAHSLIKCAVFGLISCFAWRKFKND